jgi:hypothetical protein
MRGNPDNLRQAAARKSAAAQTRAEQGLRDMIRRNEAITFRGLAQTAGVSLDFLYRHAPIRQRVEHLRTRQQTPRHPRRLQSTRRAASCAPSRLNSPRLNNNTETKSASYGRPSKPPTARSSTCAPDWAAAISSPLPKHRPAPHRDP